MVTLGQKLRHQFPSWEFSQPLIKFVCFVGLVMGHLITTMVSVTKRHYRLGKGARPFVPVEVIWNVHKRNCIISSDAQFCAHSFPFHRQNSWHIEMNCFWSYDLLWRRRCQNKRNSRFSSQSSLITISSEDEGEGFLRLGEPNLLPRETGNPLLLPSSLWASFRHTCAGWCNRVLMNHAYIQIITTFLINGYHDESASHCIRCSFIWQQDASMEWLRYADIDWM